MGILVLVHEGGHFLAAKLSDVKVNEFSIGMGPQLLKKQGKETLYCLRLLPIGGYVKMEGEDEESEDKRSFFKKPVYKKIIIVAAGAIMNLLLGFIIMFFLTVSTSRIASTQVAKFDDGALSQQTGLESGDIITKIDNDNINTFSDISFTLTLTNKEAVDLTVIRNGSKITLSDVKFPTIESDGIKGMNIDFTPYAAKKTPLFVIKESFFRTTSIVKTVWVSFLKILSGSIGVKNMSGPVGITSAVGQATSYGFKSLIYLIALITVNLGIVNLLPLPALDGGRLVFLFVELIRRKPVPQKYEGFVHFVGFALLMVLLVFLTYNDILRLFGK